jgi:hypothetical protein
VHRIDAVEKLRELDKLAVPMGNLMGRTACLWYFRSFASWLHVVVSGRVRAGLAAAKLPGLSPEPGFSGLTSAFTAPDLAAIRRPPPFVAAPPRNANALRIAAHAA